MADAVRPRVLIGPSGAGKSTLAAQFAAAHPDFRLALTHTTRPRRPGEDGSHVFVPPERFRATSYLGTLEIFGASYGLPPLPAEGIPLVLLRLAALEQFMPLFPDAQVVQVEAPVEVLMERLRRRGDQERADRAALSAEIRQGRGAASGVVRTDQPMARSLARLAELLRHA
jgi:guanylate kinase